MGSLINGNSSSLLPGYHIRYAKGNSSRINAIVSVLLWMQQGMLRFSKFSIHIRKRLTIFHEAYARYRLINKGRSRAHHLKGREERLKVQLAFLKSNTPYAYWSG
ncbi:hypothetical protein Peur_045702 [Populus x canadensis]